MGKPEIVTSSPAWAEQFATVGAALRDAFGSIALRIDHIGSTAVPDLAAKDCIDVQITIADVAAPLPVGVRDRLAELGYDERLYLHDHVPAGSDDDPQRWAKQYWNRRGHPPDVNLHIRSAGSPNQRYALLFRDYLRARPAAASAYAAAKRALATVCADVETYADVKDPVVDIVMVAAEDWAAATDWTVSAARP